MKFGSDFSIIKHFFSQRNLLAKGNKKRVVYSVPQVLMFGANSELFFPNLEKKKSKKAKFLSILTH